MVAKLLKVAGKIASSIKPLDTLLNKNNFRKNLAERLVNIRKDYPFEYVFEITTRCNHFCKMCTFKHKEKTKRGDMSFEVFRKFIDEIPPDRDTLIEFAGGGEPLMHKEFLDFLAYGKRKLPQGRFFLSTNGTYLDEKMGRKLIEMGLDLLNIGLNAATKEGHKWLTNANNYDLIIDNSKRFLEIKNKAGFRKPYTFVQIIECGELEHEIKEFVKTWKPIADNLHIRHVIAGKDESVLKSERITQIYEIPKSRYPCVLPFRCLSIAANGDLFPCNIFSHEGVPWANIESSTIKEMWESARMKGLRKMHLEGRYDEEPFCKKCDMWGYSENVFVKNFLSGGRRKWL